LVPLGQGERIGIVLGPEEGISSVREDRIRDLLRGLDEEPRIPADLLNLAERCAASLFCGPGTALRAILPPFFFRPDPVPSVLPPKDPGTSSLSFLHDPDDLRRWGSLAERLTDREGTLVLFPDAETAGRFFALLPEERRRGGLLWPAGGTAKRMIRAWEEASTVSLVVGGPGAVGIPMTRLSRIVLDLEESEAWRRKSAPLVSLRSIAALRAVERGASLLLAGRLLSARAYLRGAPASPRPLATVRVIDPRIAPVSLPPHPGRLLLGRVLVALTGERLRAGGRVLWLLDRKGFAREVACVDCGTVLRCGRCGSEARCGRGKKEGESLLTCLSCGARVPLPLICPACGGRILQGEYPGIEALAEVARSLFPGFPVAEWTRESGGSRERDREILSPLGEGGLLVGTRAALALCDRGPIPLIAWIDAEAEARRPDYDARFRAMELFAESMGRGGGRGRTVLLQGHRTARVAARWDLTSFWRSELEERRTIGLPPFRLLLGLRGMPDRLGEAEARLENRGIDAYRGQGRALWASGSPSVLREALSPLFRIEEARNPLGIEIRTE
jgi:primosomal protein N' (replication factor Y)